VQRHIYRDNLVVLAVLLELEGVVALIAINNKHNVPHGRVAHTGESLTRASRSLLPRPHQNTYPTLMPLQQQKSDALNER
jgi:hypothetical protein